MRLLLLLFFSACQHHTKDVTPVPTDYEERYKLGFGSVLSGKTGTTFDIFGKTQATPVVVNQDLWKSAMEALSFMPLVSADPYNGIILTDWYLEKPSRRLKIKVQITGSKLSANALTVFLYTQERTHNEWYTKPYRRFSALEDIILEGVKDATAQHHVSS